jgi:hypothetical protein
MQAMRSTSIFTSSVTILIFTAGCVNIVSFARSARRRNIGYDRVIADARELGDADLAGVVESLGESRQYNSLTDGLLSCLGAHANAERWERQSKTGSLISKASITARAQTWASSDASAVDRARFELDKLGDPETVWLSDSRDCAEQCYGVAHAQDVQPRDRKLAERFLGLCTAQEEGAEQAQHDRASGDRLVFVTHQVEASEAKAAQGCFRDAFQLLEQQERNLAQMRPSDGAAMLTKRIAAERGRFAEGFARVAAFEAEPRVIALRKRVERLRDSAALAHVTVERTRHVPGTPTQASDSYEENAAASKVVFDLDEQIREVGAQLETLAKEGHIACP